MAQKEYQKDLDYRKIHKHAPKEANHAKAHEAIAHVLRIYQKKI